MSMVLHFTKIASACSRFTTPCKKLQNLFHSSQHELPNQHVFLTNTHACKDTAVDLTICHYMSNSNRSYLQLPSQSLISIINISYQVSQRTIYYYYYHPSLSISYTTSLIGFWGLNNLMDLLNSVLNFVVPPASLVMLAFSWPALCFISGCEWLYNQFNGEDMEDKVVIITGASSGIGEQIAYEYAKRRAKLVLVARRETRLRGIGENARFLGAKHVLIIAADVVKEEDCRRFINETINIYGRVDHLVNTVSLGHTFSFEEVTDTSVFPQLLDINFWGNVYPTYVALPYLRQTHGKVIVNASVESWLPLPRMSLYAAAKAALVNFYETLRLEVKDDVGITIATHGWIVSEMSRGKFMVDEGAEMQWKEEREVHVSGGPVEDFARLIVAGACRGDAYVKYPSWYDIFLLYRVFAPNILNWTFRMILPTHGMRRTSLIGTGRPISSEGSYGRPLLEGTSPRRLLVSPTFTPLSHQHKLE